jgi:hypothetical protein
MPGKKKMPAFLMNTYAKKGDKGKAKPKGKAGKAKPKGKVGQRTVAQRG